ncbi:MAG: efflux RND transporter periplasmic adaptor subunit [Bacteroidales bacterium]|jgi:HlyD family secretion protein|nr:efflux RND transporter periplasmic adaptor subunit [Bacteroidales bacterium]
MKRAIRIFSLLIITGIIAASLWYLWEQRKPEIITWELVSPEVKDIANITIATGNIEPRDEVPIKPQISGIISEILKKPGDMVRVNDVIAKVKVVPELGSLNAAESRTNVARINMQQIEAEYRRNQRLFQRGVIAREDFEISEAAYNRAREEVRVAADAAEIVRKGVTSRYNQYSNTEIRSTIAGMILDIPVKVGNTVTQVNNYSPGTTIANVANMKDLIFRGNLDETVVGQVKEGTTIKLLVGAIKNRTLEATLEYISPKGQEIDGAVLFEIKASVHIPDTVFLRASYSANAEIILADAKQTLSIPESAVEFVGADAFVYVFKGMTDNRQQFDKQPVTVGLSDGVNIEIREGITADTQLRYKQVAEKNKMKIPTPK